MSEKTWEASQLADLTYTQNKKLVAFSPKN